jgi:hypothetical protein
VNTLTLSFNGVIIVFVLTQFASDPVPSGKWLELGVAHSPGT